MGDACGVYAIVNAETGRAYIGKSINLNRRKNDHFSKLRRGAHGNNHLQASFMRHGEETFLWFVLELCAPEVAILRENYYLDKHRALAAGGVYNQVGPAEAPALGRTGWRHTPEAIEKMRAKAGHPQSPETREKLRNRHLGTTHTDGAKRKMSEQRAGKSRPRGWHVAMAKWREEVGLRHSEETKRKMSEKARERFKDPNKIRRGWRHSAETRAKMSEARKRAIAARKQEIANET